MVKRITIIVTGCYGNPVVMVIVWLLWKRYSAQEQIL